MWALPSLVQTERKALAEDAVRHMVRDGQSQGGAHIGITVQDYGDFVDINVGGG